MKFSILYFLALFLSFIICGESVRAQETKTNIVVRHLFSYTAESMGGVSPSKLFVDKARGELYVIGGRNIAILNENGVLVYTITIKKSPNALFVNKKGDIYLSYGSSNIDILNYRGEDKGELDLSSVPDFASITVQSLHIDEDGNIYIGDSKLSRIIVLNSAGKFLYQFGKKGSGEGEFLNASAITTDAKRIYLIDPALSRVSVFKKGGEFLFKFGRMSSLLGGFSMPAGMDTDGERLFVVDANRTLVVVFDMEGRPITEFGERGRHEAVLTWPSDVKVDGKGKIYVVGGYNRVQVYELVTEDR